MASTAKAPKKPLCFVIGPIGRDGSPERKHADLLLHAVIKEVLEAEEFGYQVKRADEDADPGMIGDRVITDITHAELVVADLTDLNPNAFYELGIRHSAEKPTIHVARSGTQLPFDNVPHRTIFIDLTDWQSIKEGRTRLAASARAISEPGFQVSNPITQANASFKLRQSADPRDRVISDLQERLTIVEKRETERLNQGSGKTGIVTYQGLGKTSILANLIGSRVLALWQPDSYWYSGTVKNISGNRFFIEYDDGQRMSLTADEIMPLEYRVDDPVECRWNGQPLYYVSHILKIDGDNITVQYDCNSSPDGPSLGETEQTNIEMLRFRK
jgi:hypothetical protein